MTTVGRMAIDGPPMQRNTIFRIASMSKPITAAAVMMLIDDGKLRLDEPVDHLLPELANRRVLRRLDGPIDDTVPARRAITVEDLLTFRLGWGLIIATPWKHPIQRAIAELRIVGFGPPDPPTPFDSDEWMRRLGTLPLFAQPGEQWLYTTGSDIQGMLIVRASGQPLSAFLADRIFGPLGMNDTGFHVPAAKIGRLATAYRPKDGTLVIADEPLRGKWSRPPLFEQGDAGLVSTADDYLAFARLLLRLGRWRLRLGLHRDRQQHRHRSRRRHSRVEVVRLKVEPAPVEQEVGVDAVLLCQGRHRRATPQASLDEVSLERLAVPAPCVLAIDDSLVQVCT